jgi:polyhydroxybutyrate depolymerase
MIRTLAPALLAVGALTLFACAPASPDTSDEEDSGSLAGPRVASDSGMAAPRQTGADAGSTAETATGSAQHDAVARGASNRLDASADAARSPPVDASRAEEAGRDSRVDTPSDTSKASAGCGKSGRPGGGRVSVQGQHNYTFPASYDGKKPFPLLLGFHAAGNPIDQIESLTKGSAFDTDYVRAFPKSKGSAWDYATDIGMVIAMYDELMESHCIDTERVFAVGHSSGAQLIVQILTPTHKADADHLHLKAVAPVAASRYGTFSLAIPVMYIQGQRDNVRNSDGSDVVKEFVSANGCTSASQAYTAAPSCTSNGKTVRDGCVQYDACKVPTVWCSHDDPQYSNTNHGWPCFATRSMSEFFAALP